MKSMILAALCLYSAGAMADDTYEPYQKCMEQLEAQRSLQMTLSLRSDMSREMATGIRTTAAVDENNRYYDIQEKIKCDPLLPRKE